MRSRAFMPDALGRLEDRIVPSHVAGLTRGQDPVALSGPRFNLDIFMVRGDFELFATSGNFEQLRARLAEHTRGVPFHQADGLGTEINAILAQMQTDISSGIPKAIAAAHHRVVDTIRADVRARIDDGSVVVVR